MADIKVWRSGRTSTQASEILDATPVLDSGNGLAYLSHKPEGISLTFQVNGGKGKSEMIVWIKPEAFAELAEKMLSGSPKEGEIAFLSAMLKKRKTPDAQGS